MQIVIDILLLLDLYGPEPLDSLLGLRGGVVVAFVGVGLGDTEGEEGEGEELEDFLFGVRGG